LNIKEAWRLDHDPDNEYRWNTFNCRDREFTGDAELIISGCSQTVGEGVPEKARWGNLLASKLKIKAVNIAEGGWSTQSMINATMSYIKRFGKPKIIIFLLPDFGRFDILYNTTVIDDFSPGSQNTPKNLPIITRKTKRAIQYKETPKLSKKPHKTEDTTSLETSSFLSGQFLSLFSEYCKAEGIKFLWASWHKETNETVHYASSIFSLLSNSVDNRMIPWVDLSSYVDVEYYYQWPTESPILLKELPCHSDLKNKYKKYFDSGTDKNKHMGVHMHAHIADKFYEVLQ
jgi:hypothetical protein